MRRGTGLDPGPGSLEDPSTGGPVGAVGPVGSVGRPVSDRHVSI